MAPDPGRHTYFTCWLESRDLGAVVDTSDWRAACDCGWASKWTSGWKFPARVARFLHRRAHRLGRVE